MPKYSAAHAHCHTKNFGTPDPTSVSEERQEFQDGISLILEHQEKIISCPDYFFCPLSFANCTVCSRFANLLVAPLRLGHIIVGWRHGNLVESCPQCQGKCLVTSFGGHNGIYWWRGLCLQCRQWCKAECGSCTQNDRQRFVSRMLKRVPEQLQEDDSICLQVLIGELRVGKTRNSESPVMELYLSEFRPKRTVSLELLSDDGQADSGAEQSKGEVVC